MDTAYKTFKLLEIADVKRANGEYPEGTIYIQVSASPRCGLKQFRILKSKQVLESKYAVVIPKINVLNEYLYIVLTREEQEWRHKYTGNNINIQMDSFKYLNINIHKSLDTQKKYVETMKIIDEEIESLESTILQEKELKKWFLSKMMA